MEKYVDILFMFVKAFAVGGAICTVAQVVINKTKLTAGRILVIFMLAGVALEAFGLYDYIVQFAGAGATVPLTGFGWLMAEGVKKAVAEDGLFGVLSGGMTAASAGLTAAVVFGLAAALFSRSRDKS